MKIDSVKDYYGKTLSSSADLITDACCDVSAVPARIKAAIANTHEEVRKRYYGCGLTVPLAIEGCKVLDLGCGAGRDVYALAQLAGPLGSVTGIDMTPEQLDIARGYQAWHAQRFGHDTVHFVEGELEQLGALGLEPESFDVIVSNCVINLVTDKPAVLAAARALLKPGGEMFFADVYADRRQDPALAEDPVLYGECLSGALYWNDFLAIARGAGFADPRLVEDRPISIENEQARAKLGATRFYSATYRLFAIDALEASNEDYGQHVTYRGGIEDGEDVFILDKATRFERGVAQRVSGNSFAMLANSRFAPFFSFDGDFSTHYGVFDSAGGLPFDETAPASQSSRSCC